ncbi:hypothetical protein CBR_g49353 [Chara braunii]|uniref:Uncharacterized protein n=1 Tax=Chara braunii TaxID=69332 RepID=A0A388M4Q3_CHABU|nr:hypothetical protein CBR_g49353 [Chara braunii]|eukprot:GBG89564.1 hypothetical protein CBR_g49353 [Chara braunii]
MVLHTWSGSATNLAIEGSFLKKEAIASMIKRKIGAARGLPCRTELDILYLSDRCPILCEKVDALEIDRDELVFTNAKLKADLGAMTKARDLQSNHAALLLKEKNRLVDQLAILKKEMKNSGFDDRKNIRLTGSRSRRGHSLPLPERSENVLEPRPSENLITNSQPPSFAANRKGTHWACVVVSSDGLAAPSFRSLPPPTSSSPVKPFGRSMSTTEGASMKHHRAFMSLSSSSTSSLSFSEEDEQEEETERRSSGERLSAGFTEDVSDCSLTSSFVAPNQLRKALLKLKEEREALLQQVHHLQKENAQLTVRFRGAADARKRVEGFCKRLQLQAAYIPR